LENITNISLGNQVPIMVMIEITRFMQKHCQDLVQLKNVLCTTDVIFR